MPEGRRQGPNHHQGDQAREEAQNADPMSLDSPALTRRRDTPLSAARESAQVSRDIFFLVSCWILSAKHGAWQKNK